MRKFFIKMLLFLSPIIIGFIVVEAGLSTIDNGYTFKKRNFESEISKIQVLNFGSSHADYGIDPECFSVKGYNMANVSQSLYYDRSILQKYIGSLANLKLVILPVSYFSFGYDISETDENWRMNFYKKVYGIDCEGKHDIFDAKGYSYFALYGKEESLRCIFNGFKVNYAKDYKRNGVLMESSFDIKAGLADISDKSGKKRIEFHNSCIKPENYEKNISYMNEIIETLEKRKIKVVLITTPVYKTYSQNMNPKYYEDMQNIIKKITDKYGIKYYNYIDDSRFVVEDFRNNDHLNPNGAVKFSKILNNEILSKEL